MDIFTISFVTQLVYLQFALCSLTFCSLGSNQISDEGACAVATVLQVNQSLQELK